MWAPVNLTTKYVLPVTKSKTRQLSHPRSPTNRFRSQHHLPSLPAVSYLYPYLALFYFDNTPIKNYLF